MSGSLVVIGIAPSGKGEEGQPLSCIRKRSTGDRLRKLLDIDQPSYLALDRVNLYPYPTRSTITSGQGRPVAEMLSGSLLVGRRCLLLGPNVAECFGLKRSSYELLEWREGRVPRYNAGWRAGSTPPFDWAVVPHPSGRNRWYNDPNNEVAAKNFLRGALALSSG